MTRKQPSGTIKSTNFRKEKILLNLLSDKIVFGNQTFGFGYPTGTGNPAVYLFGFPIYLYALIIVTGMTLAILISALLFKKRGIDPYDVCYYALSVIPFGVLGARLYVFVFPWQGRAADWSTFFDFRGGGLGIYGDIILGFLAGMVMAKIKKHDFRIIADCAMPGVLIAQSIGRWGNFVNQEAHGPLITNPNLQWFPFGVEIGGEWYYATFFYESMATLLGFIICLLLLRSKKYKLGWLTAFYGIYYGIARLLIESLRTDSLYLWIGKMQTDIKISQLVSVFTIALGLITIYNIYRKDISNEYKKMFATEHKATATAQWLLLCVSLVLVAVSVVAYVSGGESMLILGFFCDVFAVYTLLASCAMGQRKKLLCTSCNKSHVQNVSEVDKFTLTILGCLVVIFVAIVLMTICFVRGIKYNVANSIVLGVALLLVTVASVAIAFSYKKKLKALHNLDLSIDLVKTALSPLEVTMDCCGKTQTVRLNKVLLTLFAYNQYRDFGVSHLKPWVDPDKQPKNSTKQD